MSAGANTPLSSNARQQAEMQIAVNPADPMQIAGVSTSFISGVEYDEIDVYLSQDGGATWNRQTIGGGGANLDDGRPATARRFDPTVGFDANGRLYVGYGVDDAGTRELVVAISTDGGSSFSYTAAVTDPTLDKFLLATGRDPSVATQQNLYLTYVVDNGSGIRSNKVAISTDGGATFSQSAFISDQAVDDSSFAMPVVGPNGELFIIWDDFDDAVGQSTIKFDVSTNAGASFGTDVIIGVSDVTRGKPNGFTPSGRYNISPQPDRGILAVPSMAVDPATGDLYATYTVATGGATDDTDIVLQKSTDGGGTWSTPSVVHSANTNSQFLPWVTVDPLTSTVYVAWMDARNDTNNRQVELFIARSTDGGTTFAELQVAAGASDQSQNNAARVAENYLEYVGLAANAGVVYTLWPDNTAAPSDLEAMFARSIGGDVQVTITGDAAGDDTVTIRESATNSDYVEIILTNGSGTETKTVLKAALNGVIANLGGGMGDQVTIETSPTFLLPGGLQINKTAGSGGMLTVNGSGATTASLDLMAAGGQLNYGSLQVDFNELADVIINTTGLADVAVTDNDGGDTNWTLGNDTSTAGRSQITTNSASLARFSFANPTSTISLTGDANADAVTLNSFDGAFAGSLQVDTGGGDDTAQILSSSAVSNIDLGTGNDSIIFGTTFASSGTGAGDLSSIAQPLSATGAEDATVDNGAGSGGTWYLQSNGSASQLNVTGMPAAINLETAALQSLLLEGSGGDDVLTVDFASGNPLATTTTFNGAGQTAQDTMVLQGGTFGTIAHVFDNANDGRVVLDGAQTIDYTGLEPIVDNNNVTDRVFTFTNPTGDGQLSNVGGLTRISSSVNEQVDFSTPTNSLTIQLAGAAADSNTFTIAGLAAGYNTPTNTIQGIDGNDAFIVEALAGGGDFNLVSGLGDDTLSVTPTSGTPSSLAGNLNFVADGGNDSIVVDGSSETTDRTIDWRDTQATGILGGTLDYSGIESFDLTTGSGDDTVTVAPSTSVDLDIDFNTPPSPNPPGDRLVVDLAGTSGSVAFLDPNAGNGTVMFDAPHLPIDFISAEQIDSLNGNLDFGISGTAGDDTFLLQLDAAGTNIQVFVNGTNIMDKPAAEVERLFLAGLGGDDQLVVDGTNGLAIPTGTLSGIDNPNVPGLPQILYDGGAGNDSLLYQDLAAGYDVTYGVGTGTGGGVTEGEVSTRIGGADQRIYFRGLEPIYYTTPGGGTLSVIGDTSGNNIIIDAATPIPGWNATRVAVDAFEPIFFGGGTFTTLEVYGQDGADTITMDSFGASENALTQLTLSGLQPGGGEDGSDETINLRSNRRPVDAAGVNTNIVTGTGNDRIAIADTSNTVSDILGDVNVNAGGTGADVDILLINDSGSGGPSETVFVTSNTVTGITGVGGIGGTVTYSNVNAGRLVIMSNAAGHDYRVRSTAPGLAATELWTGGGDDTITVTDSGTANGVVSPIELFTGAGNDSLVIDDRADVADNIIHMNATQIGGGAFGAAVTPGGIFGAGGILTYGTDLESIEIEAGDGDNTINVDATGVGGAAPIAKVVIDDGAGDSSFFIQANAMAAAADQRFDGNDGNDVLHVFLAAGTTVAGNSFVLDGNDPAGDSSNRDAVLIHDAGGARAVELDYQSSSAGDIDVRIDTGTPIDANSVETLRYFGDSDDDDTVEVIGTAGDDDLTIAPQSASSFLAFIGGNPWDGPSDSDDFDDAFPGVAGGSYGPDMQVSGVRQMGLTVTGGGAGAAGDQLYVYGKSESDLEDSATSADPFGFGAGVLIPGTGAGDAYDRVEVSDGRVRMVNNAAGPLVDVNIDTASFAQTDPTSNGLIVNTGFEAAPAGSGIADDITAFLSFGGFAMNINGGDPAGSFAPQGDRLNVITPGEINVFSDKSTPPEVSITSTQPVTNQTSYDLGFSSIENVTLTPGLTSQTVNIYGDNNLASVDQPDNFVVTGGDVDSTLISLAALATNPLYNPTGAAVHPDFDVDPDGDNEFFLQINGSTPIGFRNVTKLNVAGDDQTGTPSSGNDIDRLEVTPYADNTPTGWGIDVRFDEGNPGADATATPDMLVVNGVNGVAELTTVTPSAPGAGQVSVQNAATGTPIVVIDYTTNTGLEINGNDGSAGDTDRLSLLGSDGVTSNGTSGRETAAIDFTASGQPGSPVVRVSDAASGDVLYELFTISQAFTFDTVTVDLLAGDDTATANAGAVDLTVVGGAGNDSLTGAGTSGLTLLGGDGDDDLTGSMGDDRLEGGSGNDRLSGGQGNDRILGGAGADFIHWGTGDGTDSVEGGAGDGDLLHIVGDNNANTWRLSDAGSGVAFDDGTSVVFASEIEVWNLLPQDGSDSVSIGALTSAQPQRIEIGPLGGAGNQVMVAGTSGADRLEAGAVTENVAVTGLPYAIEISGASAADGDILTLLGGDGDDRLSVADSIASAFITELQGGAGNDELYGAAGTQRLVGGEGNDQLYASDGDDTASGGSGVDQLIYAGTAADDALTLTQAGTTLNATGMITGGTTVAAPDVERIVIVTAAGNDRITLDSLALPTTVDAGAGNDSIDGNLVTDASLTLLGGDGNDVIVGGGQADLLDGGAGGDRLSGGAGGDVLLGGAGGDVLIGGLGPDEIDGGADSDLIEWTVGDGNDAVDAGSGQDRLSYRGSGASDIAVISSIGRILTATIGAETVAIEDLEQLDLNLGDGGDEVIMDDLTATPMERVSVDLSVGNDAVTINGRATDDNISAGLVSQAVSVQGMSYDVVLTGTDTSDRMLILGNDGDDVIKVTPGVDNQVDVMLEGGDGDDYLSADATLVGGTGNDVLVGGAGNDILIGGAGDDTFIGGGGTDQVAGGTGTDRIYVPGTAGSDTVEVQRTAAGELQITLNGSTTIYGTTTGDDINTASIDRIAIDGNDGNDAVTVINDNGLITFSGGIYYEGGAGVDTLNTQGSLQLDSALYSVGPQLGGGVLTHSVGNEAQTVYFSELEPVFDTTTAATATVIATGADNAIGFQPAGNTGAVSVDGHEVYIFNNKTTLNLRGQGGNDAFDIILPASGIPSLTTIVTDGGSGAGDTVTVRDLVAAPTSYTVTPLGAGASDVTTGIGNVEVRNAAGIAIQGVLGDLDRLTINGTPDGDVIAIVSDGDAGTGRVAVVGDSAGTAFDAIPFTYQGFTTTESIIVDGLNQQPLDRFVLDTSEVIDVVDVAPVSAGSLDTVITHGRSSETVNVFELRGVGLANVRTLGGPDFLSADSVNIDLSLEAGSASEGNVLDYSFPGQPVSVAMEPESELVWLSAGAPFRRIGAVGFRSINVTVDQTPTVNGSADDEKLTVTPRASGAGAQIEMAGNATTVNTFGSAITDVDLSGGDDLLRVVGQTSAETIAINGTQVVTPSGTVNFTGTEALEVSGGEGSDTFNVLPSDIPVFIDGGDPIGVRPGGDRINITAIGPISLYGGPENDEGAVVVGTNAPVSFDYIEELEIIGGPGGAGPVTVFATNADDEITVIARDGSTRATADGIEDFTISLNQGPEVYFENVDDLRIDGLAGDDDFTLRTPAPNGAAWNTNVVLVGGPGTDVLDLETPGESALSVNITPTGPETGLIGLTELNSLVVLSQDPLPQTGQPIIGGNGGFERVVLDGETNGDNVTIFGSQGNDSIVHAPGTATDAGEVRVNTWLPIAYEDLGVVGRLTIDGNGGNDGLAVLGTSGRDVVTVAAGSGSIAVDNRQLIETNAIGMLSLETLEGDDVINVSSPSPYGSVNVEGGDPGVGSDVLRVNTAQQAADTITWAPSRANPHDQALAVSSGPAYVISGIEAVELNADNTDNLQVLSGAGNDLVTIDRGTFGERVSVSGMPGLEYRGVGQVAIDGEDGSDEVRFVPHDLRGGVAFSVAGDADDQLTIVGNDARGDSLGIVAETAGGFRAADNTSGVSILSTDPTLGRVVVEGRGGDDNLTVDVSAGLIPTQITFLGGDNRDLLTVTGDDGSNPDATYTPGPTEGDGRLAYDGGQTSMVIDFAGLEPVVDLVPGNLLVQGTNADNAINYTATAGNGWVTIDGQELIMFSNKVVLGIVGGAGDDVINLRSSAPPVGLTSILIGGSDSTIGDTVVINGTGAADTIGVDVTGASTAQLTGVLDVPTVGVSGVELLIINGQGGDDTLDVTATGSELVTVTPGDTVDSGDVQIDSRLPLEFRELGSGGELRVTGTQASTQLRAMGTAGSDTIGVGLIAGNPTISVNAQVPIITTDITSYILSGLSDTDTFNVTPLDGISMRVEGGDSGAGDKLNVARDVAGSTEIALAFDNAATTSLGQQVVAQTGMGRILHTGIEQLALNATGGDVVVSGTRFDDTLTVTPQSADSTIIASDRVGTEYMLRRVNELTITGGAAGSGGSPNGGVADQVLYVGTNAKELIRVDSTDRTVELDTLGFGFPAPVTGSYLGITLDDGTVGFGDAGAIEIVSVESQGGSDTIQVVPGAPNGNGLYINVDGGEPQASDALVITALDANNNPVPLPATDFVVVGHSRNPDAGNVIVYQGGQRRPGISYQNVEVVSPNVSFANGDPNLLILGADNYEENQYRQTAAYLGAGESINVPNLAIFPNAAEHPGVPADQDYFRVVAETTGVLDFQVYFRTVDPALLPAGGQLNVAVLDSDGTRIAGDATIVPAGQPAFGTFDQTPDARIRIPAVAGQTYYLNVFGENNQVVNGYDLTVDNYAPPVPYDIELDDLPVGDGANSDTGRSHFDNITRDNTPIVVFRLDEGILLNDLPGNGSPGSPADEVIPIPFQGSDLEPGYRVAVFVEGAPQQPGTAPETPVGYARRIGAGVYEFDFDTDTIDPNFTLTDGSQFISARVEMVDPATPTHQTGFGGRSASLEIFVDTIEPPVFFGLPGATEDGLAGASDSGVTGNPDTFTDRVTSDTTPTLYGYAEADSFVRLYVDTNGNGAVDAGDVLLGQVTAQPYDGNNQFPNGQWEITSLVNLNDPEAFPTPLPQDGLRRLLVTAEDVAGNISQPQRLNLFIDTQGPQVTRVYLTNNPGYDLFDPKPSTDGPSPLAPRLTIDVRDLPNRSNADPNFLYDALDRAVAENPGHYSVVGDFVGRIPIRNVLFVSNPRSNGNPATGQIILEFFEPLPDDRFTLTISDAIVDPAGNALDGESHTSEPHENPVFPSGDGQPGGDFTARFTIDTRPELGTWAAGSVWVDTNGNTIFDPNNSDYTNRDITYTMGYTSDDVFAGNFAAAANDTADRFDKLAVYGRVDSNWRFLVDTDNDGVPNIEQIDPLGINGTPFAGRFDNNDNNGDEVGVFTGTTWYFDVDHDFQLDAGSALATDMRGWPVVGDFDGDGFDDLATWADDRFQIDLANGVRRGWDGAADYEFRFGFIGVRERPVSADFNMDGYDDLGLWVPDRSGVAPIESGEWYILMSGTLNNSNNDELPGGGVPANLGPSIIDRIVLDPIRNEPVVNFEPVPFGNDIYVQYGDDFALPVVGNFDPPVTPDSGSGGDNGGGNLHTNLDNPLDVNDDGFVTPQDALLVINDLGTNGARRLEGAATSAPYLDVNMDGLLSPLDALSVINGLAGTGSGEGEGGSVMVYRLGDSNEDSRSQALAELDDANWIGVEDAVDSIAYELSIGSEEESDRLVFGDDDLL